ncbi:MAG: DUF4124 domain-containing protein [Pseudomonadota bacterium]
MSARQLIGLVILTAIWAGQSAEAQIYKWVDENGVVHYSDQPLQEDAKQSDIQTSRTDKAAAEAALAAANQLRQEQSQAFYRRRAGEDDPQNQLTDEQKAVKEKSCIAARKKLNEFAQARRLYKVLPDGQKAYLTEAEILEARAEVQAAIQDNCD